MSRNRGVKCVMSVPLGACSTLIKLYFQDSMCVICLVDCHVNAVISYHILRIFRGIVAGARGWWSRADLMDRMHSGQQHPQAGQSTLPNRLQPPALLLLLHWKAHLLHFPRGVEVERAQTPCSTKNTHIHSLCTQERQQQ